LSIIHTPEIHLKAIWARASGHQRATLKNVHRQSYLIKKPEEEARALQNAEAVTYHAKVKETYKTGRLSF